MFVAGDGGLVFETAGEDGEAKDAVSPTKELVAGRLAGGLCWMRVFSRSAGCRRTAERRPEHRPAAKWDAVKVK